MRLTLGVGNLSGSRLPPTMLMRWEKTMDEVKAPRVGEWLIPRVIRGK